MENLRYFLPLLLLPLFLKKGSGSSGSSNSYINSLTYVKQVKNIPFATGNSSAIWPIYKTTNKQWNVVSYYRNDDVEYDGNPSRAFGTKRSGGDRYHVGIDLYCNDGDICVATEDGEVVAIQGFLNITKAMLVQTYSGIVLLYGEIRDKSWNEFNITEGSIVKRGQPICRMGYNTAGTVMLHFETYTKGTRENAKWYVNQDPPPNILNPTKYLLNCLHNSMGGR